MTLLNKSQNLGVQFLKNEGIYHADHVCLYMIRSWEDNDYFLVEFFKGDAFETYPVETVVPKTILEKIKDEKDNTYLYISNIHEAFLDIVEPLYKSLVIDAKIPARKIYIATGTPDLANEVVRYADENNFEYMNVEWVLVFEEEISTEANHYNLDGSNILTNKKYDKKFLNFNRRWRLHRPAMVALLKIKGLLDKGYVSLALCDDNKDWQNIYPSMLAIHEKDPELHDLFVKHKEDILNIPSLYLDFDDLIPNRALLDKESLYFYENSLISLVSETTFYPGKGMHYAKFFSEKIFKPIAVGHPFILISVPKSLEKLKELGYRTFHPYIDESYDDETDDFERLKKIVKEVERISNFTDDEVKEFCKNVRGICFYNQILIKSKTLPFITGNDPGRAIMKTKFVRKVL